jgi:Tol biopolymer transport system component
MKHVLHLAWAGLVGVAAFGAPASAAAPTASIVYVKNHNVWLAKADGSGQTRLTRDGIAASPYYSPTQADNGTIVALRGPDGRPVVATFRGGGSKVYRLSPRGKVLGRPRVTLFEPVGPLVPRALAAEVSPNGRTLAISQLLYEVVSPSGGRRELKPVALNVVYTDVASGRYKGKSELVLQQLGSPSWIDNKRLLVFDQYSQTGAHVYVASVGRKPVPFYRDPARSDLVPDWNANSLGAGELTRGGDKFALVRAKLDGAGAPTIEVYAAHGVSAPPAHRCTLAGRDITLEPGLSWSPDGRTLSWFEDSGIWSTPVKLNAPGCGFAPRLVIRGGISPD